jgi:hypothetical protein
VCTGRSVHRIHQNVHDNSPQVVRRDTVRKIEGLRKNRFATYTYVPQDQDSDMSVSKTILPPPRYIALYHIIKYDKKEKEKIKTYKRKY